MWKGLRLRRWVSAASLVSKRPLIGVWCATNVDGAPGTTRIDLGTSLGTLIFPYAWDTYYFPQTVGSRITGRYTTACAFINGTDRFYKNFDVSESEYLKAFDMVKDSFFFVYPEKNGIPDFTIDQIESVFEFLVWEKDVKAVVVDPYIKIRHEMTAGEPEHPRQRQLR